MNKSALVLVLCHWSMEFVLNWRKDLSVGIRISKICMQASVMIFNFLKYGVELVVLEISASDLIGLFCILKTSDMSPKQNTVLQR
jgi:hypothetical protein